MSGQGADGQGRSRRVDALVSERSEQILQLVEGLVRLPTYEPAQCRHAALFVKEKFFEAGFRVETHDPIDQGGATAPILLGWLGERTTRPDILLCVHIDTSPAGDGWTRDPFGAEQHNGLIYGRGAAVSKSDVGCFLYAAECAWKSLVNTQGVTIAVAATSDEGAGGNYGAGYLLESLGIRPRLAVFPGFTDVVTVSHNGCIQIKVRLVGTACHQSLLRPKEDAMRAATDLCTKIYTMADRLIERHSEQLRPTLNVTKVAAGTVFGMAPRQADVWIDRRVAPQEDMNAVRDELLALVDEVTKATDCEVTSEVVRMAEPMRSAASQQAFVSLLKEEARAAFCKNLEESNSTLYTDARWYSNAGIPTVMYGAGEADVRVSGANGVDERVPAALLTQATTILARAMTRFISEPI
ncbi:MULTISPECIES: M20 family metallopeptidase [Aminobacter]|uniref:M20 family metallopeptidase n=1 Tax=Aminobacter TaxID=31988 RepID=UPI0012B0B0E0|nr:MULTISPECIES: M20/M25/M40 family metallo-hydrolase [Aminobacter]MDR7225422.1 acetylornithine deacetylase/succinyl-diaminopimelate desuccinylase-like protein [Aminobacter aminovorans]QNH33945.1 M20/M25/M40 family metallo-hydrolase [Aminobacter sp. MDW-2]